MIDRGDVLERLAAANPVPLTPESSVAPDAALLGRILAGDTAVGTGSTPRRLRRARRWARPLAPVLAACSLLSGVAAYALLADGGSKPQTVACYGSADLEAPTEVVAVEEGGAPAACADLWRRGVFGEGVVPQLQECTLHSGVVGVFPAVPDHDVCTLLAIPSFPPPEPPGTPPDLGAALLAFRDAVRPHFVGPGCVEPRAGAAVVRRELDRAGLADWQVRGGEGAAVDGFSQERPCASLSFRPEAREVLLVPAPPRR